MDKIENAEPQKLDSVAVLLFSLKQLLDSLRQTQYSQYFFAYFRIEQTQDFNPSELVL